MIRFICAGDRDSPWQEQRRAGDRDDQPDPDPILVVALTGASLSAESSESLHDGHLTPMDRLKYIGHGTTLLRLEGTSILTDPILRGWLGPLRRHGPPPSADLPAIPDVVLISHLHRDHLDVRSLRRIPSSTPLVVPHGATRWAKRSGADEIREIGLGETISVGDTEVTGVRAVHSGHRDRQFGEPIEPLGYLIRGGNRTVYFAGDTDLFPEMSELGPVDVALLPVWGWGTSVGAGHLDPHRAAHALELIRPRLAIPIHWGTFFPFGLRRFRSQFLSEPGHAFARWAAKIAPDVEVRVLEPGDEAGLDVRSEQARRR